MNKVLTVLGAVAISTATAFVVKKSVQILMEKKLEQELLEESE